MDTWQSVPDAQNANGDNMDPSGPATRLGIGSVPDRQGQAGTLNVVENISVVCSSCGTMAVRSRPKVKRNWWVPQAITLLLVSGITVTGISGLALFVVFWLCIGLVVSFIYFVLTELSRKWSSGVTCVKCGGEDLQPVSFSIDRLLPCPECGERAFRISRSVQASHSGGRK